MLDNQCCPPPEEAVEHLRNAERDLHQAREKEREAQKEIDEAEAEIKKAIKEIEQPRVFNVDVLYDGLKKPFKVHVEATVNHLLDQAIRAFGQIPNPHTLSLYNHGKELVDAQTIEEAGIKPCDVLLLRPSTVKGGA